MLRRLEKVGQLGIELAWRVRKTERFADTCENIPFSNAASVALFDRSSQPGNLVSFR